MTDVASSHNSFRQDRSVGNSKTDNGMMIANPNMDGGFASIGYGTSRALPAGGWRLPSVPFDLSSTLTAPTNVPADARPWITPGGWDSGIAPQSSPPQAGGVDTTPATDTQRLMDLFAAMFGSGAGTSLTTPLDPNAGSVVVYGDPSVNAQGSTPSMSPIVKILLLAALAYGAWWAWKKWGRRVAQAA